MTPDEAQMARTGRFSVEAQMVYVSASPSDVSQNLSLIGQNKNADVDSFSALYMLLLVL